MGRYEAVVVLQADAESPAHAAERIIKLLRQTAQSVDPDWLDGDDPGDHACLIDADRHPEDKPPSGEVSLWVNEQSLDGVFKILLDADPEFFEKEAD